MADNAGSEDDGFVDIETLGFEQAQAELEAIVQRLEDPRTGLDQALALWERGEALHAWCQARLDNAQARIEKLQLTPEESSAAVAAAAGSDDFAHAAPVASTSAAGSVKAEPAKQQRAASPATPVADEHVADTSPDVDAAPASSPASDDDAIVSGGLF